MESNEIDTKKHINHFSDDFFRGYLKKYKQVVINLIAAHSNKKIHENEVDEILQESIITCYQKSKDPDFVLRETEDKFFYGVARNKVLEMLRKNGKMKMIEINEIEIPSQESSFGNDEWINFLNLCLELLKGKKRDLLTLFYSEKRSMKEISEILGFANDDVVKSTAYRVKNEMEECLKSKITTYE